MKHVLGLICALLTATAAHADVSDLRVGYQPGIIYLAPILMRHDKLIEQEAARLGIADLHVSYTIFGGGGAQNDALISGNLDIATTGPTNMLLAWDRTHGQIKGIAGSSATPLWLVTRNPAIKSLKDFTDQDRIAVPTVKISSQAIILQIAARKLYGDANFAHFDTLEVTSSHPDAMAQLLSGSGITAHFSGPPYQAEEAAAPGMHVVAVSDDILGQPFSNAIYFGPAKFHDANPVVMKAFMAAAQRAADLIAADPRAACETYRAVTGEKTSVEILLQQIGEVRKTFSTAPFGIAMTANHMTDTKTLKTRPAKWQDTFFPEAAILPGN